jgi:nucleotidyltransferase/DNA polymerase involved in DNA repair
MKDDRQLKDLSGVDKATLADLRLLGVRSVAELAREDAAALYQRLCQRTGRVHDICCFDVFCCAVAQARDPNLPREQRNWWFWTAQRKRGQTHLH